VIALRRYLFILAVAVAVASSGVAAAIAGGNQAAKKTPVCHATKSKKHPYVKIMIANKATLAHHRQHSGDIIGTAGQALTCPSAPLSATGGGRKLSATLAPVNGNTVGSGTATIRSNIGQGRICWSLTVTGLSDVTAAHIHYGTGPNATQIAVPFALPTPFTGTATGCVNVARALVKQILQHPGNFYVNVHTTAFPAGAIQGTLSK
jgi:CHRD domain